MTPVRRLLFRIHGWLGLSAGLVLAVMGATGAAIAYADEIVLALNAAALHATPAGDALAPDALLDRARALRPGERVQSAEWSADPGRAVRVVLSAAGKGPRGEALWLDPYRGALIVADDELRGRALLRTLEDVHRRLALGEAGTVVTGGCAGALLLMSLIGLYLRWPRPAGDWKRWLAVDRRLRGRALVRSLHAVIGTWALLICVVSASTGVILAFKPVRDGLYQWAGLPVPAGRARAPQGGATPSPEPLVAVDAAWRAFSAQVPAYATLSLRLPEQTGKPITFQYLDLDAPHRRAFNRLEIDAAGAMVSHERYADKPLAGRLLGSVFMVHSGEFFGAIGRIAVLLGALALPLFAVTGWMLYLQRRRRSTGVARPALAPTPQPVAAD